MKTRNFMVPAMIGRYRNTGTKFHDRRVPRGGDRNRQIEMLADYNSYVDEEANIDYKIDNDNDNANYYP